MGDSAGGRARLHTTSNLLYADGLQVGSVFLAGSSARDAGFLSPLATFFYPHG